MTLLLHGLTPMHWAAAGAAISVITLALLFMTNRRLGISSGFEDICSLALPLPHFRRRSLLSNRPWRLPFIVGLLIGGFVSAVSSGSWQPTLALGLFDERLGFGPAGKLAWMFVGGVLIGFGTRLGNGCTSGHGIFGMSNFERSSFVTTLAFMAGGIATTNLIYRVMW